MDDDAGGATAPVGRARRVPRSGWALLLVAAWLLLIGAALLRPGGRIHADVSEHPTKGIVLPPMFPGTSVEQTFVAGADGLSSVTVRFGLYGRQPPCTVVATLLRADGTPISTAGVACTTIPDAVLFPVIVMPPQAGSAGQQFRLRLAMSPEPSDPIALFGSPATPTVPVATYSDGQVATQAVELHTEYGDDAIAAAQIGTALDRIGEYGPPWQRPIFLVTLVFASLAMIAGIALAPRRWALVLLILFVVSKGLFWSAIIPPLLGPDEGAHFAYAQLIAVNHEIPKRGQPQGPFGAYSHELDVGWFVFHQPSTPAPGNRADFGPGAIVSRAQLEDAARDQNANGSMASAGYTPAYYAVPALIHALTPGTLDVRIGVMRLWSIALGAVTVWASVLIGRRLFPGHDAAALLLGAAVGLQPMLTQQTAIISNDAMIIALGAVCTLIALELASPTRSRWWAAWAGLAFGVAMLAKPLAVAFAPVLFIAWVLGRARGARVGRWWWEAAAAVLGVLATYGAWTVFATVFGYGGIGLDPATTTAALGPLDFLHALKADSFLAVRANWVDQLWGDFGWLDHPFPPLVQGIIIGALLVGSALVLAWCVVSARDAWRARRHDGPWSTAEGARVAVGTTVCLLVVLATLAELYVLMFDAFRRFGSLNFIQGRYALMAAPAILVLPVMVLRRLAPRVSPVLTMAVVAGAMAVLNVIGAGLVIEAFYL